jgi:hypothetical protein
VGPKARATVIHTPGYDQALRIPGPATHWQGTEGQERPVTTP